MGFKYIILQHTWREGTRWSGQPWPLKEKWMTHGASETWVLMIRGRGINLPLAPGRNRRLLLRRDLRDKTMAIKAKAKPGFLAN